MVSPYVRTSRPLDLCIVRRILTPVLYKLVAPKSEVTEEIAEAA